MKPIGASHKTALALIMIAGGGLLIISSPMVVFADAAVPFFRAVGLAQVGFISPVDGACSEWVRVHHARAFGILIVLGVLAVFAGTHLFVRGRRTV